MNAVNCASTKPSFSPKIGSVSTVNSAEKIGIVVDECDEDLTNFLCSAIPEGVELISVKDEYAGVDEKHFMPEMLGKYKKLIVLTSDKTGFNTLVSSDCCVVTFSNSGMGTQVKIDLVSRLFVTQPFRSLSNFFDLGHIAIEKNGRVTYTRHGKQVSKFLPTPHPHNKKAFTLLIKK